MRVRLVITGRVQGVWYRASLRDAAISAGVAGWARNCPDGSVEAVLDGPGEAVERVFRWCRTGPPGAVVQDVAMEIQDDGESLDGFQIRY